MCDVLVDTSLRVVGETSLVWWASPLSLWPVVPLVLQQRTQLILSSCTGEWYSSIFVVCGGLLSRFGMPAPLSLWNMFNTLVVAWGTL